MTRKERPKGSGTIVKRPGGYLARLVHKGERFTQWCKTESAAEAYLADLRAELDAPKINPKKRKTKMGRVIEDWMRSQDYAVGSATKNSWILNLLAPFEERKAVDITTKEIEQWLRSLSDMNEHSRRRALGVLRRALDTVYLSGNPAQHVHVRE